MADAHPLEEFFEGLPRDEDATRRWAHDPIARGSRRLVRNETEFGAIYSEVDFTGIEQEDLFAIGRALKVLWRHGAEFPMFLAREGEVPEGEVEVTTLNRVRR